LYGGEGQGARISPFRNFASIIYLVAGKLNLSRQPT
jgi:hypothetical protein